MICLSDSSITVMERVPVPVFEKTRWEFHQTIYGTFYKKILRHNFILIVFDDWVNCPALLTNIFAQEPLYEIFLELRIAYENPCLRKVTSNTDTYLVFPTCFNTIHISVRTYSGIKSELGLKLGTVECHIALDA